VPEFNVIRLFLEHVIDVQRREDNLDVRSQNLSMVFI
jgi:hypothetical protein